MTSGHSCSPRDRACRPVRRTCWGAVGGGEGGEEAGPKWRTETEGRESEPGERDRARKEEEWGWKERVVVVEGQPARDERERRARCREATD